MAGSPPASSAPVGRALPPEALPFRWRASSAPLHLDPVFGALHPALLGGIALVGIPVLIHLLLRQRPRPRPWAAMRWLLAAAKAAQRRWRLTNLLLLLARCAVIALAALAMAQPQLSGIGGGHHVLVVIDRTASMGARGSDAGPLAAAKAALAQAHLPYERVTIAAVDRRVELFSGPPAQALADVAGLEATPVPGGLDAATRPELAKRLLAEVDHSTDVLLVSDFAQDDGTALQALLTPVARSVQRWRVGAPAENAAIVGVEGLGDQLPDVAGAITLRVAGCAAQVQVAVDDAPPVPVGAVPASPTGVSVRVPLPPLAEGEHRIHLAIDDHSLAYDNVLDLPLTIRPRIEAVAVRDATDYVSAALHADDQRSFLYQAINPAQLAAEPLPARGIVLLRGIGSDPGRLAAWVRGGGVLWASVSLLDQDPDLHALIAGVQVASTSVPGGNYTSGSADIDEGIALARRERVPDVHLPPTAEVVLRAGDAPVAVAVPAGRGWVVCELVDLASDKDLEARATTPLWVVRTARALASRLDAPRQWLAGAPAPQTATLKRAGDVEAVVAGEPLLLAPGTWTTDQGPVVVLPSREEGRIERMGAPGAPVALEKALPHGTGANLGPLLAVLVVIVALAEGTFAAWAGRTYGR